MDADYLNKLNAFLVNGKNVHSNAVVDANVSDYISNTGTKVSTNINSNAIADAIDTGFNVATTVNFNADVVLNSHGSI